MSELSPENDSKKAFENLRSMIRAYDNDSRLQVEASIWLLPENLIEATKFNSKYKNDTGKYKEFSDERTRQDILAICGVLYANDSITKEQIDHLFEHPPLNNKPLDERDWEFFEKGLVKWNYLHQNSKKIRPNMYRLSVGGFVIISTLLFVILGFLVAFIFPFIDNALNPKTSITINRIYTEDNHLYAELCGYSRSPIQFVIQNTTTGFTWNASGSQLEQCKSYRVVNDMSGAETWYWVDIITDEGHYVGHLRCFTNPERPFFCRDTRIQQPENGKPRQIEFDLETTA
jgi:hypothetical protein